jgi:ProP effector
MIAASTAPRKRAEIAAAAIALLAEQFPKCFAVYERRRRPLKVGIYGELLAALDGAITERELHAALGVYTSNLEYLRTLVAGAARIDLNGTPVGTVTREEAEHAKERLLARRHKKRPTTTAAPSTSSPPPAAPPPKRLGLADLKAAAQQRKATHHHSKEKRDAPDVNSRGI